MELTYRTLLSSDMQLIFEWNNDVQTRKNSFQSDAIQIEQHKVWFSKKIADKKAYYLIALFDKLPIALIRYDVSDIHTSVGITVSNDYRGKGLSSQLLKESALLYFSQFKNPLLAYIKPENIASIKSFEKAGYVYIRDEMVSNQKTLVYMKDFE
jgi:L-amino acid N-acyltransferase YncA